MSHEFSLTSACKCQILVGLLNRSLSQQPTFHLSYFQSISFIMVTGAQKGISEGVTPDPYCDLSLPSSVKYFCIWIKPHILQMLSGLKSDELPRWFKKRVYLGGVRQSLRAPPILFFFDPVSFVLIFCQISLSV